MYGRPLAYAGGGAVGGGTLAVTGFYVGGAIILALVLVIVGLVVLRVSYMKRTADETGVQALAGGDRPQDRR